MPKAAQVGFQSIFQAHLFVPNGTVWLQTEAHATGAFVGQDVIVGLKAEVFLESGWMTPLAPQGPLAKPVVFQAADEAVSGEPGFGVAQNYPNPFNPVTTIQYTLSEPSDVNLTIYNALGQQVRVLVNGPRAAGVYRAVWDGRDALGRTVASGLYLYRLRAGAHEAIRKMVFAK